MVNGGFSGGTVSVFRVIVADDNAGIRPCDQGTILIRLRAGHDRHKPLANIDRIVISF